MALTPSQAKLPLEKLKLKMRGGGRLTLPTSSAPSYRIRFE